MGRDAAAANRVILPGQIHDGKHCLLAGYAHAIAGMEVSLDIFWGRAGAEAPSAREPIT